MAQPISYRVRFRLPARIRTSIRPLPDFRPRLSLVDRIADMPGVVATEDSGSTVPRCVRVFLRPEVTSAKDRAPDRLFCEISLDGILVHGLKSWDKHQVLSRGWGRSKKRNVLLHLPRDETELDVCWLILQRAYDFLIHAPAVLETRLSFREELSRFSRATLH